MPSRFTVDLGQFDEKVWLRFVSVYRDLIVEALSCGRHLTDLVDDRGFTAEYASVRR
jgi:hypothetical protein